MSLRVSAGFFAVLAAGFLLATSTAARAAALWRADFETGNLFQLSGLARELPDRIRVASAPEPVWAGRYSARFELRAGDIGHPNHGHKVQAETSSRCDASVGSDLYFSLRLFIAADYPAVTSPQAISYWRASGTTPHVDPIELRIKNDRDFSLHVTAAEQEIWSGPFRRGAWNEIVVHARFDVDATKGFVELWLDRLPVLARTAAQTMTRPDSGAVTTRSDWQIGNFPLRDGAPTYVLYFDDVTCGTTFADVAGGPAPDGGIPPRPPATDAGGSTDTRTPVESRPSDASVRTDGGVTPPLDDSPPGDARPPGCAMGKKRKGPGLVGMILALVMIFCDLRSRTGTRS